MSTYGHFPETRLRRLRHHPQMRNLVRETQLSIDDLILPLFIKQGSGIKKAIASMPGQFQLSPDLLEEEVHHLVKLGIKSILLFGIPDKKDALGSDSYSSHGIIQTAIPIIKKIAPQLLVISDICFCEYTDHGHCGHYN